MRYIKAIWKFLTDQTIFLRALDSFEYRKKWYKVGERVDFRTEADVIRFLARSRWVERDFTINHPFGSWTVRARVLVTD